MSETEILTQWLQVVEHFCNASTDWGVACGTTLPPRFVHVFSFPQIVVMCGFILECLSNKPFTY